MLLYAACTVNADFLAPYDPTVTFTPRLAEFARDALVFERHMTEEGQTGIAYASIISGRHADGHGVFYHPTPIDPEIPLIGDVFQAGGFQVEQWLAHVMASGDLGYGRGADRVYDLMLTADTPEFEHLLRRLQSDADARVLVVASQTLTHAPYRIESLGPFCARYPAECALRQEDEQRFMAAAAFYLNHTDELSFDLPGVVRRFDLGRDQVDYLARVIEVLYQANVARLDFHFGTLLDAIDTHDLSGEALVVFTADHGEAFDGDQPPLFRWSHGFQLAPDVLRTPLLIRGPKVEAGRYDSVTRSTDLLPTLAALAGLDQAPVLPAEPWNGVDLSAAVLGRVPEPELDAYSHTSMMSQTVVDHTAARGHFRRWHPRNDPQLMWAQLRSGDERLQLRGTLVADGADGADGAESVHIVPARLGPGAGSVAFDDDEARLERLHAYRQRLIDAWHERTTAADRRLDEAREQELLRSLGYID